ncbi:MAG TPA: OsmC family protein [Candidatus Lumbricidophila sp.]|nr:OsmC family protein [Candidatus Lumbricidophila sp.]
MTRSHHYEIGLTWTGNIGAGTASYRAYTRDNELTAPGAHAIAGTSDPAFRGDPTRWNPEQLFVASIAQCHMLWYLSLAAQAGVVVMAYEDHPTGVMVEEPGGGGAFEGVTLHPVVTITDASDADLANELHHRVGELCFIARSIKTPIAYDISIRRASS